LSMKKIKKQSGFTLIELLISLGVVVLVVVGFIHVNLSVHRNMVASYEESVAYRDAHQVVEQMRDTARVGQFPDNVVAAFPNNGVVAGFNNISNETIVVTYANTAADPLNVTVSVTWLANGVRTVFKVLETWITQR
jgi:prepilin-type N-terminal cleavage/methylation domain-containing protein